MAVEAGINCVLRIGDGASTETFTTLRGQQDTQISLGGEVVDITDKAQQGWESMLRATRAATVTVSGQVEWPDTEGIERLRAVYYSTTEDSINCQVVLNEAGNVFSGAFIVETIEISAGAKDVTRYSATLRSTQVLTYS